MLKAIQLGQQLTKNEMKQIKGGCCAHYNVELGGDNGMTCGLSMAQAKAMALEMAMEVLAPEHGGASWCCASC